MANPKPAPGKSPSATPLRVEPAASQPTVIPPLFRAVDWLTFAITLLDMALHLASAAVLMATGLLIGRMAKS